MNHVKIVLCLLPLAVLIGCATPEQQLEQSQDQAIQSVMERARFDMNCPEAKGTVLSQKIVNPVFFRGVQRMEYTIGVTGCNKRQTYVSICPEDGTGCFAADDQP